MHNRIVKILSSQCMAAVFVLVSASAQAGLQEANAALAGKDYATALKELEPLAAKGDAYAQYQLGEMYNHGSGVPHDEKMAVSWYRKSAEQGYADAQTMMGIMYDNRSGVPLDYKKALFWYRKAAEQGDVMAQSLIGSLYVDGHGVPVDFVQALKWFTIAADRGYEIGKENVKIIETKLNKKQVQKARAMAQEWQKKHTK